MLQVVTHRNYMQLVRTEVVSEDEIVSAQTTEVTTLLTPTLVNMSGIFLVSLKEQTSTILYSMIPNLWVH